MADTMTKEQRHRCMSRIKARDTKPELMVRRFLWHNGYRYRLYDKRLPGRPDIIMRKHRVVIFVNGCFWHGHQCDKFRLPQTNTDFWRAKIERNRNRDRVNCRKLNDLGFNVITVWECDLAPKKRVQTLNSLLLVLNKLTRKEIPAITYQIEEESLPLAAESTTAYRT